MRCVVFMNFTAYLRAIRIPHEFVEKSSTHHASDASRATGIPLAQIAKSIVFTGEGQSLLMAVVRADHMVSRHKLEASSGLRRMEVASDAVAEKATGYPTGGIPPVGHRRRLPVYVDVRVAQMDYVWCGGGTRTRLVRLNMADLLRLAAAIVCDITVAD